jgi:NDP-sugar pyrophosphorylase family protein
MKGIILAGGKGSRLHPITLEIPKPLIPIKKWPLINYNLGLFAKHGIEAVKVIIRPEDQAAYEKWQREYASEWPGMRLELVEEPEPMGTFGFVFHNLKDWAKGEELVVSNGDDIKQVDIAAMLAFHRKMGTLATVALVHEREREDAGFVLVKADKISDFLEKKKSPEADLISAGLYILSPGAFAHASHVLPAGKNALMFETDLFPALAAAGELAGFVSEGKLWDCGTLDRWAKAIREA